MPVSHNHWVIHMWIFHHCRVISVPISRSHWVLPVKFQTTTKWSSIFRNHEQILTTNSNSYPVNLISISHNCRVTLEPISHKCWVILVSGFHSGVNLSQPVGDLRFHNCWVTMVPSTSRNSKCRCNKEGPFKYVQLKWSRLRRTTR